MKFIQKNNLNYDSQFDTLHFDIGDNSNSYGDEEIDNIILLYDINTDELTGITILNFLKMYSSYDNRLNLIQKYLPTSLSLKDLFNYCSELKAKRSS